MNKPSWFQPLDLVPLLLAAGAVLYAFLHGFETEHRVQATILLIVAPVLMWLIVGYGWYLRKRYLDSCIWYPTYGFMLDTNNEEYLPPAEQEFDAFVTEVVNSWRPFHPAAERIMKSHVKWVYFRRDLNEKPISPRIGLVKGITVAGGSVMYVDFEFKYEPLKKTALAHELGHAIRGLATGVWDQEEHHAFTKKNHLR